MELSRVLFQRITSTFFEHFLKETPAVREVKIASLVEQLEKALKLKVNTVDIFASANRLLYNNVTAIDGVGIDITIERNIDCSGMSIKCVPLKGATVGQAGGGSVELTVYDKELLVLMINQRSLFLLSQTKWSSLVSVAEWFITLVRCRRIYVRKIREVPAADSASRPQAALNVITASGTTASSSDPSLAIPFAAPTIDVDLKEEVETLQTLLDVSLNRDVPIDKAAFLQWRSRHVPRINGLSCKLVGTQSSETLILQVQLKVPHQKSLKGKLRTLAEQC